MKWPPVCIGTSPRMAMPSSSQLNLSDRTADTKPPKVAILGQRNVLVEMITTISTSGIRAIHLNRCKDALIKRNVTRATSAQALTKAVRLCDLVNPYSTRKKIFSSVVSGFTLCSSAVRPSIGISCSLRSGSQVGHGNNLEHQHEYNECNRRDESAKECARQDNVDETEAKKPQDKGNQPDLELQE